MDARLAVLPHDTAASPLSSPRSPVHPSCRGSRSYRRSPELCAVPICREEKRTGDPSPRLTGLVQRALGGPVGDHSAAGFVLESLAGWRARLDKASHPICRAGQEHGNGDWGLQLLGWIARMVLCGEVSSAAGESGLGHAVTAPHRTLAACRALGSGLLTWSVAEFEPCRGVLCQWFLLFSFLPQFSHDSLDARSKRTAHERRERGVY